MTQDDTVKQSEEIQGGIIDRIFDREDEDEQDNTDDKAIVDDDKTSDDEILQGFIRERRSMQADLAQAKRDRASLASKLSAFRQDLKTARDQQEELVQGRIKLLDNIGFLKQELSNAESSRKGLIASLRQTNSQVEQLQTGRKGLIAQLAESRADMARASGERTKLRERLREAAPLQGLIKRGISVVWLLFIFLGMIILLGGILIIVVLVGYSRLKKRLPALPI